MTLNPRPLAVPSLRSVVALTLPAAAAIAVFGTLYGAGARAVMGVPLTLASSLLIYSGALQFALVALVALLAFFLVDETFGFAIAAGNAAEGRAVGPAGR